MMEVFSAIVPDVTEDGAEAVTRILERIEASCMARGILVHATVTYQAGQLGVAVVIDGTRRRPGPTPRPLAMTCDEIKARMRNGASAESIADMLGVSRATLYRRLTENG